MSTPSDQIETVDEITVTGVRIPLGRQPRTVIQINGVSLPPCAIEWTVVNNSFLEADTFELTLAANRLPSTMNAAWFSSLKTDTFVEIFGGLPDGDPANPVPSELTSFIYGRIDDIEFQPVHGTIMLKGRDLTGAFIDTKVSANYTNQTSSQIVILLAAGHGIATIVSSTKTPVGNYFATDTLELTANRSEWDLLAYLARQEGFVVDMLGGSANGGPFLYFGDDLTGNGTTLNIKYQPISQTSGSPIANAAQTMKFSRIMTVAKGISVTVRSAGRGDPNTVTRSYPTAPRAITPGRSTPFGSQTQYYYNIPAGATPQQCVARAEVIYNQIIQHAMKATFELPADTTTDVTSSIMVSGTGTSWDQEYFPREITRTLKFEEGEEGGFSMTIECQNTDPNLQVADTPSGTPPADEGDAGDDPAP